MSYSGLIPTVFTRFRPHRDLAVDDGGKLFRAARLRLGALDGEPAANVVTGERCIERLVELLDDRARRAGRRCQTPSQRHVVARKSRLREGRHLRKERGAPGAGHAQRVDRAGEDVTMRVRNRADQHADMAAEQIVERRTRALVGHMRELHAGPIGEQLDREVIESADAGRSVGNRSCGLLADLDQLGERTGGKARMHRDQVRGGGDQPDRIEVLARVIAEVLHQAGRRADRRAGDHQQRVAIGRGLGDRTGRNRAAGAAAIVDDDLLAERLAHLVGNAARGGAGAAARGERDHQGDRARGVALRRGGRRRRQHADDAEQGKQRPTAHLGVSNLLGRAVRQRRAALASKASGQRGQFIISARA